MSSCKYPEVFTSIGDIYKNDDLYSKSAWDDSMDTDTDTDFN